MEQDLVEAKAKHHRRRSFALITITISISVLVLSATFNAFSHSPISDKLSNLPQFLYCEARAVDRTIKQIPVNYKLALHVTLPMLFKRCREGVFNWE
jgi:hypothetical protein